MYFHPSPSLLFLLPIINLKYIFFLLFVCLIVSNLCLTVVNEKLQKITLEYEINPDN